jgi:hypothetical protein
MVLMTRDHSSVRRRGHNTNMCSLDVSDSPPQNELPLEMIERRICEGAADLAAAMCRWLFLVAEYDARRGWAEWGTCSCAHWLSLRCGISLRAAQEHTRVARALTGLPLLSGHFRAGELSYTKVRAVTRVAEPENEADLVEIARHSTGAQLDKVVQGYLGVIRVNREQAHGAEAKQGVSCIWGDDGMLRIEGRLAAEDGAVLMKALEAADPDDPDLSYSARRAMALVALARGETDAPAEVVVHVDADTLSGEQVSDQCRLEAGPTIAPELARRLGCDAAVVTIVERDGRPLSVGRRTRAITPALRRALASRDQGCRFPGCTNTRYLHAHHIEHWARGGGTEIGNLVQLCSGHHRCVHEGGYRVELDASGTPCFYSPGGWEIPGCGQLPGDSGVPLRWQNGLLGVHVDADTSKPLSMGDSIDYGIAVEGLAHRWLPPPGGPPLQ